MFLWLRGRLPGTYLVCKRIPGRIKSPLAWKFHLRWTRCNKNIINFLIYAALKLSERALEHVPKQLFATGSRDFLLAALSGQYCHRLSHIVTYCQPLLLNMLDNASQQPSLFWSASRQQLVAVSPEGKNGCRISASYLRTTNRISAIWVKKRIQ